MRERPWLDRDDADIDAYVRAVPNSGYDLARQLRSWRDDGLVIFEQAADKATIDEFLADVAAFHAAPTQYKLPIEIRGAQLESTEKPDFVLNEPGVKINQIHCFSKAAARLSLTRNVADFLSHVLQGPPAVAQSLTFWRGSEQSIHIDYPYVCQQRRLAYLAASWVALEDVHPDSGPLAYYPGGHRVERSGFFDWGGGSIIYDSKSSTRTPTEFSNYLAAQMQKAGLKAQTFCPKKGDVLIWHGNLPHEGTRMKDPIRTRKSYVTHFTSLRDLPDWMRPPLAEARGQGVFENNGYSYRYPWFLDRATLPSWQR